MRPAVITPDRPKAQHPPGASASGADSSAPLRRNASAWLLDTLLTTDPVQRLRLAQAGLAMLMLATGVLAMHYYVAVGVAPAGPVAGWSLLSLGGMAVFFGLIRSGWSRRCRDASLSVPQMVFALSSGALAYALLGAGRGGVFPIVMVILMFGMFSATPRQVAGVSAYAVASFGAVMAWMSWLDPAAYPPAVELGHFLMVATMMPAVSLLAARLCRMRQRARAQRAELAQALARIRELATHDELTGLINHQHMQTLLAQEHQRCVRSGQTFCVAMLDIDRLAAVNARLGVTLGDVVIHAVAQEALRHVRVSDLLARWGGDTFVLLLPDARAALVRGGLERLQQRVGQLRIPIGLETSSVTVSAGLAEHMAGETVAQTLQRAEEALREAKAQGRDRVVAAT